MARTLVITTYVLAFVSIWPASVPSQRRAKAPRGIYYEIVRPVVIKKDPHSSKMVVKVPTQFEIFVLNLNINRFLMPSSFKSVYFDERGRKVVDKTHYVNCYYQGSVVGHPNWTVSMRACHGLQGEFGDVLEVGSLFNLEPLDQSNSSIDQPHAFYSDSEHSMTQGICGCQDSNRRKRFIFGNRLVSRQNATRIVELLVVSDLLQVRANGNSVTNTVMRALLIVNGADALFQPLNIRVVLSQTITARNRDLFRVSSTEGEDVLEDFTLYTRLHLRHVAYDSAMLLTGLNLDGRTTGIAYTGTMCDRRFSTAVTEDGRSTFNSLSVVSTVAAHELGHNLNMKHDGPSCSCVGGNCIMQSSLTYPIPTRWSSCSVRYLNEFYSLNGDFCLFNQPSTVVGGPVCGNGIIEGNETCDCGSPEECTVPCCNATSCKMLTGTDCITGACCTSQCLFTSSGTVCRAASGECDIAEYCNGTSSDCPSDDIRADGADCSAGMGACLNGECLTRDAQCRASFNTQSHTDCFDFNTRGTMLGNCGHFFTRFISCSPDNILCGQLWCLGGQGYVGPHSRYGTAVSSSLGSGETCRAFSVFLPSLFHPGLVADGTRCGEGRVCAFQECVNLPASACPIGSNGQECSGPSNGVCNSRGRCSCNANITGVACGDFLGDLATEVTVTEELNTQTTSTEELKTDTTTAEELTTQTEKLTTQTEELTTQTEELTTQTEETTIQTTTTEESTAKAVTMEEATTTDVPTSEDLTTGAAIAVTTRAATPEEQTTGATTTVTTRTATSEELITAATTTEVSTAIEQRITEATTMEKLTTNKAVTTEFEAITTKGLLTTEAVTAGEQTTDAIKTEELTTTGATRELTTVTVKELTTEHLTTEEQKTTGELTIEVITRGDKQITRGIGNSSHTFTFDTILIAMCLLTSSLKSS